MANEIEIRIGSRDNTGAGFASATSHQGKLDAAILSTRKAALAAAEAQTKLAAAQARVAAVAAQVASEELSEADALRMSTEAAHGLERAEIGLAEAHRAAAHAADHQAAQERELARATQRAARDHELSGSVFKRIFEAVGKAGQSAMESITSTASGLAQSWPAILAMIAAGIAVLPLAAIAAGGAITFALGGALAAVGIMAVAKSETVKAAWGEFAGSAVQQAAQWAEPWKPAIQTILKSAGSMMHQLGPVMTDVFSRMAPAVSKFGIALTQSIGGLTPSFTMIGDAFDKILTQLGPQLPTMMEAIGNGIASIAQAAGNHAAEFAQVMLVIGYLIDGLGQMIGWLINAGSSVQKFFHLFDILAGKPKAAADGMDAVGASSNSMKDNLDAANISMFDAARSGAAGAVGLTKTVLAMDLATMSAEQLKKTLDTLAGGTLGARAAARNFQASIDDMTAGLKKNGRTFDINTEKGRANQAALDKIAQSGLDAAAAQQKIDSSGRGAAKALTDARTAYIHAAIAGGQTRASAIKAADALGLVAIKAKNIPNHTETSVQADINDLTRKVDAAKAKLKTVPASKRAAVLATIKDLEAKVAAAKRDLAGLHNRTVQIDMHQVWSQSGAYIGGRGGGPGRATGGVIGAYADGGNVRGSDGDSAGTTLVQVGEAGRELVRLPYGSTVIPHGQTEAMLGDDGDYETDDDDEQGYASGGIASRRRHHRRRRARHPRKKKLGADSQYTHHGNGPGPTGAYNWNISQSLKNKLSNKQTKMVAPPPHVPNWWHGQASESFGPGGASLSWSAPRPEDVAGTPQAQKLSTAEIEHNAQAAIEKRVAQVVAAAMKQHKQVIEIHSNGSDHSDYLIAMLRKAIRAKGGNVQIILGK